MKHTENQIRQLVKQLMQDIDRDYYEDEEISVLFENDMQYGLKGKIASHGWGVAVPVQDDQRQHPDGAAIIIHINDDTLEVLSYLDCSCGRPVPMRAVKNAEGKYKLEVIKEELSGS